MRNVTNNVVYTGFNIIIEPHQLKYWNHIQSVTMRNENAELEKKKKKKE